MRFRFLASRRSPQGSAAIVAGLLVLVAGSVLAPEHAVAADEDDTHDPVITIAPNHPPSGGGWYPDDVSLHVRATDSAPHDTGIELVSYELTGDTTGSGFLDITSGGWVPILNEGVTTLHALAVDNSGRTAEAEMTVKIDKAAPQATVVTPMNGAVYSLGQQVTADYSCSDDLSKIASCGGTYAPGDRLYTGAANDYTVWVTAVDNAGNRRDVPVSYTVVDKFTVVERPAKVGSTLPRVGEVISASTGLYSPTPDINGVSCTWLRGTTELSEPFTHTVRPEDLGSELYYQCTAQRAGIPPVTTKSDAITPLAGMFPERTGYVVRGDGRVGETLTFEYPAPVGTGETAAPHWTRDGAVIPGADGATYTVTPADHGHTVSAFLRTEAPGYETRDYPAAAGVVVDKLRAFTVAGQPVVAGTTQVGQRLSATAPTFTPSGAAAATPFEVTVEWLRDGTAVGRGASYQLAAADAGHRMTARVTATGPGYETARVDSAASGVVAAAPGDGPGQQPGAIASKARLKLKALGKGRVRATITVVAGTVKPSGTVTIRRGAGKARTVTLKNGRAVVVLKKQRKGRAVYTVSFAGTSAVSASKAKAKTRVR